MVVALRRCYCWLLLHGILTSYEMQARAVCCFLRMNPGKMHLQKTASFDRLHSTINQLKLLYQPIEKQQDFPDSTVERKLVILGVVSRLSIPHWSGGEVSYSTTTSAGRGYFTINFMLCSGKWHHFTSPTSSCGPFVQRVPPQITGQKWADNMADEPELLVSRVWKRVFLIYHHVNLLMNYSWWPHLAENRNGLKNMFSKDVNKCKLLLRRHECDTPPCSLGTDTNIPTQNDQSLKATCSPGWSCMSHFHTLMPPNLLYFWKLGNRPLFFHCWVHDVGHHTHRFEATFVTEAGSCAAMSDNNSNQFDQWGKLDGNQWHTSHKEWCLLVLTNMFY